MEGSKKWIPLLVVAALVAGAVYMKQSKGPAGPGGTDPGQPSVVSTATTPGDATPVASATAPTPKAKLPTLIDLGSVT